MDVIFFRKQAPSQGKTLKKDKMRMFKLKLAEKVGRKKVFFKLNWTEIDRTQVVRTKSVKTKFDRTKHY